MKMICVLLCAALIMGCGPTPQPTQASQPQTKPSGTATLKWKAANLEKVYGFLVYRSEQPEGPFLRANESIIRVVDGKDQFVFEDTGLEVGKTYYYYLDHVSFKGMKNRFSGVMSKTIEQP